MYISLYSASTASVLTEEFKVVLTEHGNRYIPQYNILIMVSWLRFAGWHQFYWPYQSILWGRGFSWPIYYGGRLTTKTKVAELYSGDIYLCCRMIRRGRIAEDEKKSNKKEKEVNKVTTFPNKSSKISLLNSTLFLPLPLSLSLFLCFSLSLFLSFSVSLSLSPKIF